MKNIPNLLRGVLFLLLMGPLAANAVLLNISGGQLTGAQGVLVEGVYYDVEFVDGSCIDLYDGCDSATDFTFQTFASATAAADALLEQVFLDGVDLFDTDPTLTAGCSDPEYCYAWMPYGIWEDSSGGIHVTEIGALNCNDVGCTNLFGIVSPECDEFLCEDHTENWSISRANAGTPTDTADGFDGGVMTLWTVSTVPEPGTLSLLGAGLFGLAVARRRKKA